MLTIAFNRFCIILRYLDHLVTAGHDISDGGLISCILEMAFAGNRGVDVELSSQGAGGEAFIFIQCITDAFTLAKSQVCLCCLYSDGAVIQRGVWFGS